MKRLLLIISIVIGINISLIAQTPQKFNYQAVVRDNVGAVVKNQIVSFRIAIVQNNPSGFEVYSETHTPTTNDFGLVNLEVGSGTVISGSMTSIDWGADIYFVKIGIDASGGSNYTLIGASQLLSVPYALYAEKAGNIEDTSSVNELQALSISNDTLYLTNGGQVYLGHLDDEVLFWNLAFKHTNDSTYLKQLIDNNTNSIALDKDLDSLNEIQILSFQNDSLFLSNGGFIFLGNYDNSTALIQLIQKVNADSTYLKNLIDLNATSISTTQNDIATLGTKQVTDSTALANATKSVADNLANESQNRISGDATLMAKHIADSTLLVNQLTAINGNLTIETQNRIAGDISLSNKEVADSNYLRGLINTNTGNIGSNTTAISSNTSNINSNSTNISSNTSDLIGLRNKEIADSSFLAGLINTNSNIISSHVNVDSDVDSTNEIQSLSRSGLDVSISGVGGSISVADYDNDSINEVQVLSVSNDTIYLSNSNFIVLPKNLIPRSTCIQSSNINPPTNYSYSGDFLKTNGFWSRRSNIPYTHSRGTAVIIDSSIYYMEDTTCIKYNIPTDTWIYKASPSISRNDYFAAVVNSKIYLIGGEYGANSSNIVQEYNPSTNTWSTKTPMPTARENYTGVVVNNKIHVLGGTSHGSTYSTLNKHEIYDPSNNSWSTYSSTLPNSLSNFSAIALNNSIFIFGGRLYNSNLSDKTYILNLATSTWSIGASLPLGLKNTSCTSDSSYVYIFGGEFGSTSRTTYNLVYDPDNDMYFQEAPLPTPRHGTKAVCIGHKIYVIGGYNSTGILYDNLVFSTNKKYYIHCKN
jgi:N-acetylneuraminic acid mutarotase